ncbi:hypothetical protein [Emticicia fluvialis]|uniref:hypothetical protein n=1 Tax=Emticicia fluvialis TaxID=2974474 RepID=UPI0021655D5A|nr:hypothetical protein [Emticicia fluvialis]
MNQQIRQYLIDQCIKGIPVNYEDVSVKLNLNLALERDRDILSRTLGEISEYEFKNGRPLISSIAIYKQANDHGDGFYQLCEDLGIGKKKQLKEQYYGFSEIQKCKEFWKKDFNYQSFYKLNTPIYNENNSLAFFNVMEIEFFRSWSEKVYNPENSDHVNAKNYLLDTVWTKTKFWAEEVAKRLPEYEESSKRIWSKRGKASAIFKEYTWAKIYKKGDSSKDIFLLLVWML